MTEPRDGVNRVHGNAQVPLRSAMLTCLRQLRRHGLGPLTVRFDGVALRFGAGVFRLPAQDYSVPQA